MEMIFDKTHSIVPNLKQNKAYTSSLVWKSVEFKKTPAGKIIYKLQAYYPGGKYLSYLKDKDYILSDKVRDNLVNSFDVKTETVKFVNGLTTFEVILPYDFKTRYIPLKFEKNDGFQDVVIRMRFGGYRFMLASRVLNNVVFVDPKKTLVAVNNPDILFSQRLGLKKRLDGSDQQMIAEKSINIDEIYNLTKEELNIESNVASDEDIKNNVVAYQDEDIDAEIGFSLSEDTDIDRLLGLNDAEGFNPKGEVISEDNQATDSINLSNLVEANEEQKVRDNNWDLDNESIEIETLSFKEGRALAQSMEFEPSDFSSTDEENGAKDFKKEKAVIAETLDLSDLELEGRQPAFVDPVENLTDDSEEKISLDSESPSSGDSDLKMNEEISSNSKDIDIASLSQSEGLEDLADDSEEKTKLDSENLSRDSDLKMNEEISSNSKDKDIASLSQGEGSEDLADDSEEKTKLDSENLSRDSDLKMNEEISSNSKDIDIASLSQGEGLEDLADDSEEKVRLDSKNLSEGGSRLKRDKKVSSNSKDIASLSQSKVSEDLADDSEEEVRLDSKNLSEGGSRLKRDKKISEEKVKFQRHRHSLSFSGRRLRRFSR